MTTSLRLYFLRHGRADRQAFDGDDDALRPLVDEGRRRTWATADLLARLDPQVEAVVTSPLLRARQTAEIMADHLGLRDGPRDDAGLAPGCDLPALAALLASLPSDVRRILLVGHEPDFGQIIGEITGGAVVMRKGALARVDLTPGRRPRGELVWLLQPRIVLSCRDGSGSYAPERG